MIGAACARALANQGLSVTVVDPGPLRGASTDASAGMLAPMVEAREDDATLALKVRGRDHTRALIPELEEESGINIGYWSEGIFHVALSEQEATELRHRVAWQRQQGFAAEWMTAEEIRQLIPGAADDVIGASVAPEDGALDPVGLRQALLASAGTVGARLRLGERATHIEVTNGRAVAVKTNHAPKRGIKCGAVVLAAGCWSGRIRGLPRPISVEPVRGQMVSVPWPANEPPAIVYGAGAYTVYRHGSALVGATTEHVGFSPTTTKAAADGLMDSVQRIYPALRGTTAEHKWAGLRPMTPDGNPIVGPDPEIPNLFYATGHGRAGIMLGSLTGEIVRELVLGHDLDYDLAPIDPQRFWDP